MVFSNLFKAFKRSINVVGVSLNTIISKDDFRLRVNFSSLKTQVSVCVKTTVQFLIHCQYIKINGLN